MLKDCTLAKDSLKIWLVLFITMTLGFIVMTFALYIRTVRLERQLETANAKYQQVWTQRNTYHDLYNEVLKELEENK